MEKKIFILVVEDEPEVLDSIMRDISDFEAFFPIEMADTAEEARELIREILDRDDQVGLILCDHVLPGDNGVELLVEMQKSEETRKTRKVLITGQAGLKETVRAVNEAELRHYIAKPWEKEELISIVTEMLTDYVLENVRQPLRFMQILDGERIAEFIRKGGGLTDN
ncbi:MAG: response regulator [Balneolaceae bacterium]|nr:MAG: response regulator [Balneolaceae bacterium]